jgi:hypothetical protein
VVVWVVLGIYGLVTFIGKFLWKTENILLYFSVIRKRLRYYIEVC